MVAGPDLAPHGPPGEMFHEIVVDAAGNCWVDMPGAMPWEEPKPGIVAVVRPDGTSEVVDGEVMFPNGMAIIDETTLVVAESHAHRLTAWTISASGTLEGQAGVGAARRAPGARRALRRRVRCRWYASVPQQRCVRVAEGGEVLETVEADRGCFSCTLGGDDGRTLFIVANHYGPRAPRTGSCSPTASTYRAPVGHDPIVMTSA